jgi:RNA polymerase sigma-70 factor (ECF subfamily)
VATTTSAQQIMKNSPEGVPQAYWELVNQYREELIAQAFSVVGNMDDAEDVVQETFAEAFRNTDKLNNAESLGAWMRTVNRCNALNRVRSASRERKKSARLQRIEPVKNHTTGGINALEIRDQVNKALQTLPPNMREIVRLRYWENLSYKEIAEKLNLPVGTVGRLLCEASMQMYESVKVHLEAPPDQTPKADSQGE